MEIIFLCIGILVGALIGYLLAKNRSQPTNHQTLHAIKEQLAIAATKTELLEHNREKLDEKRDAQIDKMQDTLATFTTTLAGTKSRGLAGESLLKEVLKQYIAQGTIKTNLNFPDGTVEFAWKLHDGKYLPIDAKLPIEPDIPIERQKIKLQEKVKKEITRIQKYQNTKKTIAYAILALPQQILELVPEIIPLAKKNHVIISSYYQVPILAHFIAEQYQYEKEQGEIGEYRQEIEQLRSILNKIEKKTEAIDRGITIIQNANEDIATQSRKSR